MSSSKSDQFEASALSKGFFLEDQEQFEKDQYQDSNADILISLASQQTSRQKSQSVEPPVSSRRTTTKKSTPIKQNSKQEQTLSQQIYQSPPVNKRRANHKKKFTAFDQNIQTLDDYEFIQGDMQVMAMTNRTSEDKPIQKAQRQEKSPQTKLQDEENIVVFQSPQQNSQHDSEDQQNDNENLNKPQKSSDASHNQNQKIKGSNTSNSSVGNREKKQQDSQQNQKDLSKNEEESPDRINKNKNIAFQGEENQQLEHRLKILKTPVKEKMILKMNLQRQDGFFNKFWPQFHIVFENDKWHMMSAKKVSRTPYATYIISSSKDNFQENSPFYLGKAKSSILGDRLDIFGSGLNPKNAYIKKQKPRQFEATIVYQTRIFQAGQPRDFRIYVKKSGVKYYEDFPQIKMYQNQIPLNELYQNPHNRDKIVVLTNRKPKYHKEISGYMLNFRGRVMIPSVKNFILELFDDEKQKDTSQDEVNPSQSKDVMLFGKFQQTLYNFDVSSPLSPFVAFGIALSSFDEKYFCE